jgi:hypothetical protein
MQLQRKNKKRFCRFCNCFDVCKAGANQADTQLLIYIYIYICLTLFLFLSEEIKRIENRNAR